MCAHLPESPPTLLHALWSFPPSTITLNSMSAPQPIFCPTVFLGFGVFFFRFMWVCKRRETCNRCAPIPFVSQHFISFLTSFPFFFAGSFCERTFFATFGFIMAKAYKRYHFHCSFAAVMFSNLSLSPPTLLRSPWPLAPTPTRQNFYSARKPIISSTIF